VTFDDRSRMPPFGHRYTFFLQDAVGEVPEYIVQWDQFEGLALEYRLQFHYKRSFHELFVDHKDSAEFGKLLERMRVVNSQGESELTEEMWEACNIYLAFAFVKT